MTSQAAKAEAFRGLHDGPGAFVIPNLYPGTYRFEVQGKKIKDVTLTVGPGHPRKTLTLRTP